MLVLGLDRETNRDELRAFEVFGPRNCCVSESTRIPKQGEKKDLNSNSGRL